MNRCVAPRTAAAFFLIAGILGAVPAAAAQQARPVAPDNIVIVLDASGSMRERMASGTTRMDAAKQALLRVMKQVPETTQVGLLVFSSKTLRNDWVYPLGPLDRGRLEAAIRLPVPEGGTPLGTYLKKGADALLEQRQKQNGYGTFRLLLVTDGQATDGNYVEQYLPDVLARGITVDVIGVDMKSEHALATRVHSYRRADSPEELARAVSSVFAEIGRARKDVADADAFAALEGIPDEVAKAMLGALATSGNHPIGEQPVVQAGDGPLTEASPRSLPRGAGGPPAASTDGGGWKWVVLVVLAVLVGGGWLAIKAQQRSGKT
jgi:hypothetical protein